MLSLGPVVDDISESGKILIVILVISNCFTKKIDPVKKTSIVAHFSDVHSVECSFEFLEFSIPKTPTFTMF